MAPNLSEEEIDDLIYFARAGEVADLNETLETLSSREGVTPAEILIAAKDEGKSTCLHMATGNGNLEVIKVLVAQFADRTKEEKQAYLDATNEFGNTGVHWAAMQGHLDVVKYLVAEGASPALANDKNYVPLDLASFNDKNDVVDYFLSQMDKMETEAGDEGLENAAGGMKLGEGEEVTMQAGEAKEKEAGSS
ncbi:Ankyrin repeat-containing protein P16F5.05c [Cytospora mali]|uniref:Ankyrin repeat-containing protein P16F5.05c n=1 Tax=Cytospora mali TaxID=578113 RepID=A0A194USP8_CYTMA|nr:Ankyrin repeat-containing protein P16F5.05c [Valsa mali var. pyri (nom. inval.)]